MPLIIDCDPGKDDAVALALAAAKRHELGLGAVTAVCGNVGIERTSANARRVLEHCGAGDIPVHRGASRPLAVEAVDAAHVHGADGLGGVALAPPRSALAETTAAARLGDAAETTVAALGPLTNLASALERDPSAAAGWKHLVVMGGSLSGGNVTQHAEYNLYADPHAAAQVLGCGAPITLLTLDVTRSVVPRSDRLDRLSRSNAPGARLFAELWRGTAFAVHDACVIAYLLQPSLFETRRASIRVKIDGERRGETTLFEDGAELTLVTAVDGGAVLDRIEAWLEER